MQKIHHYKELLRKDPRTPMVIAIVFFFLSAILLFNFITKISNNAPNPALPEQAQTQPQPVMNIAQFHLFGIYDASLDNLPETQLQLTLQGTIVNLLQPDLSHAIISSPGQSSKVYHPGDPLPGGATLKRVLKDEVILENNGNLQTLKLPIPMLTPAEDNS